MDSDSLGSGLRRGQITIVASRPGVGKTTWAVNVTRHLAAIMQRRVLYFSLEQSKEEIINRLSVQNAPGLHIDDRPALSLHALYEACADLVNAEGAIDLIVIDYLQLLKYQASELRPGLRRLATDFECALVGLSQLPRIVESRPDKRPQLSDLDHVLPGGAARGDHVILLTPS